MTASRSRTAAAEKEPQVETRASGWLTATRLRAHALLLAWAIVIIVFSILKPETFASVENFRTIFGTQSVLLILTIGLLLPLIVGEFDLSIAPVLGLSTMLIAVLNVNHGWPIELAVVVALLAGVVIGAINAVLVVKAGVNAFIATLGVGTVVGGLTYALSNYTIISGISSSFIKVVSSDFLGLQLSFYYAMVLVVIVWYIMRFTPLGRHMRFAGDNTEAARLCGLPVDRLRMGAFIACGLLSAFSGVILAGVVGSADPNTASNYLLPAYAAAFLGSTAVLPGQFNPWGTVIAVYFLITGITGLQLLGLEDWIQDVFYGLSLVTAVTLSHLTSRKRAS